MSDAAIATIAGSAVTIATMVVGFLTLWVKLKYGVQQAKEAAQDAAEKTEKISRKTDSVARQLQDNTAISSKAKDAAQQAERQTNGVLSRLHERMAAQDQRVSQLEKDLAALQTAVGAVNANLTSARHEMRGHMQAITSSLALISARPQQAPAAPGRAEEGGGSR